MYSSDSARETILRFHAMLERLPEITVRVRQHFPDGSYERAAFERLSSILPQAREISARMLQAGEFTLSTEEKAQLSQMLTTYADCHAILKEIGWH